MYRMECFKRFYFFIFRGEGRQRNIDVWLLLVSSYWGPGPQPWHMP